MLDGAAAHGGVSDATPIDATAIASGTEKAEGQEDLPRKKKPKWLPLESNPEILNGFMQRVGVEGSFSFADVLGLEPDLLQYVPQPTLAVCLLFPSKAVRKPRLEALQGQEDARRAPPSTFYLIQHKEFGNACGTIAAIHTIANLAGSGGEGGVLPLKPDSPVKRFLSAARGLTPDAAGTALAEASDLHEASEAAAKSEKAQTKTPGRDDKVDGHFVVFLEVEGHLVELDGCMGFPIDHGAITSGGLLEDAARIIRMEFMAQAPGNPNFSVMALSPGSSSSSGAMLDIGNDYSVQIQSLTSMGFAEEQALEALQAAGGNLDLAVSILCG